MAVSELLLGDERFQVPRRHLMNCRKFDDDPALLTRPYQVRSMVSADSFRVFPNSLAGGSPEITHANVIGVEQLCGEFIFPDLSEKITDFLSRRSSVDIDARRKLEVLSEQTRHHDQEMCAVQADRDDHDRRLTELQAQQQSQAQDISRLMAELSSLRRQLGVLQASVSHLEQKNTDLAEANQKLAARNASLTAARGDERELALLKGQVQVLGLKRCLPNDPLDGVIARLTKKCGGNVHKKKVVNVTCSGRASEEPVCAVHHIVDLRADSFFASAYNYKSHDIPHDRNNWVCYDFKERIIVPTHYAIRACIAAWCGAKNSNLKSWIVEISMDGENWTEIDRREDDTQLREGDVTALFEVKTTDACRQFRLVQIGRNHDRDDALVMSAMEVFAYFVD